MFRCPLFWTSKRCQQRSSICWRTMTKSTGIALRPRLFSSSSENNRSTSQKRCYQTPWNKGLLAARSRRKTRVVHVRVASCCKSESPRINLSYSIEAGKELACKRHSWSTAAWERWTVNHVNEKCWTRSGSSLRFFRCVSWRLILCSPRSFCIRWW